MQGPRSDAKIVVNPLEIQNASVHLCPRACPRATSRHYAWVGRQYALKSGGNLSEFRREDCLLDFFREKPHYGLSYFRPPRTWVDRAGHYSCFHTHYELSYYRQPTTILIKIAGGQETLILTVRNGKLFIQILSEPPSSEHTVSGPILIFQLRHSQKEQKKLRIHFFAHKLVSEIVFILIFFC